MPSYRFQSMTANGETRSGVITASGRPAAIRQLSDRGDVPTALESVDDTAAVSVDVTMPSPNGVPAQRSLVLSLRRGAGRPRVGRAEMASFVRELATALEAGLPLMAALRTMRRQATGPAMATILDHLIDRVEAGAPLHTAAREYGKPFDDLTVGMLTAADATGNMTDVLHQLADLLERSIELRREVTGATIYPAMVAGLIVVSVIILVTVLIPKLIEPIAGSLVELPLPTSILLGLAGFLTSWWPAILLAIAAIWIGWHVWVGLPGNRTRADRFKLRIPYLGRLLRDVAVARFTRTLGTLATSGIPILEALRITRDTLGNRAMMQVVDDVREKVTSGQALADPLEKSGLFPPLLVQVINLGERSGRLESMLMHAATAFDRQVNSSIKLVTKIIPPLLIIVMACVGGFVLSAILLPLLQLQSFVQ